jgi:uncharacterized protein (TIGR03089 family)
MSLPSVLRSLVTEPGRPRITWYGPDERVELSSHVLDNWLAKTTHLLLDEFDAGPGRRVVLDLPWHWRTVVWAVAALRTGATVVDDDDDAVVVTAEPARWASTADLAVVALPALARTAGPGLPAGAVDAASAVMSYPDSIGWLPPTDGTAPAVDLGTEVASHRDLFSWAARTAPALHAPGDGPATRPRVLASGTDRGRLLALALHALAVDGSLVLCAPQVAAELTADPERRHQLVGSERVTVDLV